MTKTEHEWLAANGPGGWIDNMRIALRDCVELLSANQSATTCAGLDADMVIDAANKALSEGNL